MVFCSRLCKQLLLLIWKNFILQIRRPIGTAFELILPTLAVLFIIILKFLIFDNQREDRCFVTFDSDHLTVPSPLLNIPQFFNGTYHIYYAPNDENATRIMDLVAAKLPGTAITELSGFSTELDMVSALQNLSRLGLPGCFVGGAGVFFDQLNDTNLEYTIRLRHEVGSRDTWQTRRTAAAFDLPGPRVNPNLYLSEGFLQLQNLVGQSIVEWRAQLEGLTPPDIDISVRQLPYPPYTVDFFLSAIGSFLPLLLIMAFLYSAGITVKELVLEKELRIRESMLMMGLQQWTLWCSWYLKQFIFLFISVIIMSFLLKFGQAFPNSDLILLIVFFTLFATSMISFCFLISVWFNSARIGLIVGFVAWFLNYMPVLFLVSRYDDLPLGAKIGSCILSNTCMGLGVQALSILEVRGEGLTWSNAAQPLSPDDSFTIAYVYGMLILDTVGYMVLAWYINGVKPGTYGVPKPFYFPCLPSYWTGKARRSSNEIKEAKSLIDGNGDDDYDPSAHEEVTDPPEVGISIQNLTKIYGLSIFSRLFSGRKEKDGVRRKAVDNFSLDMYKGQITALLGHNGAGKTTTMSILTGLFTPSSGAATISGYSILTDMDQIRNSLGICPQHNVLFDRLTVKEHLKFFLRLKGGSGKVNDEVESMIEDLQLLDKKDVQASQLSGGMKRKLSVGIALVGGSEVVILDEPTSGMDPYARRGTWDLLTKHKQGRTILLTTHFMDEADLLGDRIAIMAEGKLKCSGSSLFLKSRYGVGYHMTIVKESMCDSSQVESLVKSMVPQAEQVTDVGAELSFILPSNSTAKFPDLFDILEARKVELGLASFGVSITTMEEVFMKVGEGTDETLDARLRRQSSVRSPTRSGPTSPERVVNEFPYPDTQSPSGQIGSPDGVVKVDIEPMYSEPYETKVDSTPLPGEVDSPPDYEEVVTTFRPSRQLNNEEDIRLTEEPSLTYIYTPNTGIILWFQQFWAMFLKRVYNSSRFWGAVVSQLALPLAFVLFGLILVVTVPTSNEDDPKRMLELKTSAISPDDVTLFYAQFGEVSIGSSDFNFSDLEPSDLGATNLLNLTDPVQAIIDGVESSPPSQTEDCCQYRYQLLDGFCASRTAGDLTSQCSDTSQFGYSRCEHCLSCCNATATRSTLPSCTSPNSLAGSKNNQNFCPSPPTTSVADSAPSGLLESENVYVAEHLLNVSAKLQPQSFFRQYQAGFTITKRDPPFSVCGCSGSQTEPQVCEFFSPLHPYNFNDTTQCPDYTFNENSCATFWIACLQGLKFGGFDPCSLLGFVPGCSQLEPPPNTNVSNICYSNESLSSCYSVDGLSADVLKEKACNTKELTKGCNSQPTASRPVGTTYARQESEIAATVWYNNQPYHMPAAALNTFHTIVLRKVLGSDSYKITVNNHPLPRNLSVQVEDAASDATGFGIGILIVFGFSFLLASFVLFLVKEKESKAKHLQFVSGVFPSSYWLATFTWDLLNALVPVIVSLILFAAFQVDAFTGEGLAAVFVLLMLTCWASIPFTYVFSFLFSNALAAFGLLMLLFFFVAMLTLTVVFLVQQNVGANEADIIHYIFLLFPTYGLSAAFNDLYINQVAKQVCSRPEAAVFCENSTTIRYVDNPFDYQRPGIGIVLTYMAVEGVVLFILTILIERKLFYPELRSLLASKSKRNMAVTEYSNGAEAALLGEDSDVSAERRKVSSGEVDDNDVVILDSLAKTYRSRLSGCSITPGKRAVRGISLAIPTGECFGLLGVNGAGKTTTFGIVTGDLSMSSGSVSVAGYDISTNLRNVQQRIGYCPQFDALIERLTGRELLTMFARLRGVPEKQIKQVVETEITRVDLRKYANKKCGSYSGGNKRKLSTAIALVGNPPIVLLDEPTTGMDPTTRRYTWDVLTEVTREGRSIILTSHSMEECEALCTRIAIMVNGSFKCLGSIQHLKSKYGAGFILQAKVKLSPPPLVTGHEGTLKTRQSAYLSPKHTGNYSLTSSNDHLRAAAEIAQNSSDTSQSTSEPAIRLDGGNSSPAPNIMNAYNTTSLHIFIREAFTGAVLLEEHQGAVTYQLPSGAVSWSSVFRLLEENKERLGIVDYSVSQTTLEQVFINFAKEQADDD